MGRESRRRYDICPDRLIVRRGIFFKSLDEVELYRVKDVRLDFSLINQMAGIGTITVTSSDETTRGAPGPARVERAARAPRGSAPPGRGRPPEAPGARDRHDARGLLSGLRSQSGNANCIGSPCRNELGRICDQAAKERCRAGAIADWLDRSHTIEHLLYAWQHPVELRMALGAATRLGACWTSKPSHARSKIECAPLHGLVLDANLSPVRRSVSMRIMSRSSSQRSKGLPSASLPDNAFDAAARSAVPVEH